MKVTTHATYEYSYAELKERFDVFYKDFTADMIAEAKSYLKDLEELPAPNNEDEVRTYHNLASDALAALNNIGTNRFETVSLSELKEGVYFPVIFTEVVEDYESVFKDNRKDWLKETQIVIRDWPDCPTSTVRFSAGEGEW
jgi:hypothetical protein